MKKPKGSKIPQRGPKAPQRGKRKAGAVDPDRLMEGIEEAAATKAGGGGVGRGGPAIRRIRDASGPGGALGGVG